LARYSVAHQKIIRAGFTDRQVQDAVFGELEPYLGRIPWAELSKPQRKREWLRLCLLVVRRLDRLLIELKGQRRAHQTLSTISDTAGSRLDHVPASTERKTDSYMDKRMNHIAAPVGFKSDNPTTPPSANIAAARRRRYTGDHRKLANERSLPRPLHPQPLVRKTTSQEVRRVLGRPASRLLLMRSSEVADQEYFAKITERTQQHTKRQDLRSQRRMRLLSVRMAWHRQSQEKTSIGDDLWQRAQEEQDSAPRKDDLWAWPRLAQRQRELLADEVEAFVRGRQ
jgi:hypothetical protein